MLQLNVCLSKKYNWHKSTLEWMISLDHVAKRENLTL